MPPISRVLIIMAMEAEALPVIDGLGLVRDEPPLLPAPAPAVSFSGRVGGLDVHVVCNGKCPVHGVDNIGTIPAAVVSYLALDKLRPDLAITAGTAGGFKRLGASIGDVYLGTSFAHHDRRIPLPSFDAYGVWAVAAAPAPRLAEAAGLKAGGVTTGNSLDWHEADMAAMKTNGAVVKEMEAAGVAWSAHLFGTPLIALKSVTDIVDGDQAAADEFVANLATATAALHDKLAAVLAWLGEGREVGEL